MSSWLRESRRSAPRSTSAHVRGAATKGASCEAVDVETAAGQHAGDVGQDAGLILNHRGKYVSHAVVLGEPLA